MRGSRGPQSYTVPVMASGERGGAPDYARLWRQLRYRLEGDVEYARDEARRAGRRWDSEEQIAEYHRLSGEADALGRLLSWMDEVAPEDGP